MFPLEEQCQFSLENCHSEGLLNTFRWYYCTTSVATREWIDIPFFIFMLLVMFMCMGLIASEGLVPNLDSLAKSMGLPPSLAGLTLMAFGNGSPDIVSTYTSLVTGNAPLAIGELIGAAFFINSVVLGIVFILHPFDIIDRSLINDDNAAGVQIENMLNISNCKAMFIRDVSFFILALIVLLVSLSDNILTRKEMLLMVGIYISYVITIITWQWYIENKLDKFKVTNRIRNMFNDDNPLNIPIDENVELEDAYNFNPMVFKTLELSTIIESLNKERRLKLVLSDMPIFHDAPNGDEIEIIHQDVPVEVQLLPPSVISKILYYITFPFVHLFKYTIPLMKSEEFDGGLKPGVNRLMQLLSSLMISPLIIEHVFLPEIGWLVKILISIPIGCVSYAGYTLLTTSQNTHPIVKMSVFTLGFLTSICWMSILVSQVIDILTLFSVITKFRTSLLGLTVFAIGNSTGDLISCIIIARMGYPLMALASCIGGPMLNILLGLGLSGLANGETDVSIPISGSVTVVGVALLFSLVVVFLCMIPFLGWRAERKLGWMLIIFWCAVIMIVFLLEAILTY